MIFFLLSCVKLSPLRPDGPITRVSPVLAKRRAYQQGVRAILSHRLQRPRVDLHFEWGAPAPPRRAIEWDNLLPGHTGIPELAVNTAEVRAEQAFLTEGPQRLGAFHRLRRALVHLQAGGEGTGLSPVADIAQEGLPRLLL